MAATDGVYIVQSPKQMVELARREAGKLSVEDLKACRDGLYLPGADTGRVQTLVEEVRARIL